MGRVLDTRCRRARPSQLLIDRASSSGGLSSVIGLLSRSGFEPAAGNRRLCILGLGPLPAPPLEQRLDVILRRALSKSVGP